MPLHACRFTFDDSPEFEGFSDGSTWNGFDNVWVTPETRNRIVAWFRAQPDCDADCEEGNQDMLALPVDDGLVSLGWGYAASVSQE
jgi:hypothetical protein